MRYFDIFQMSLELFFYSGRQVVQGWRAVLRLSLFWVGVFTIVQLIELLLFGSDFVLSTGVSWQVILAFAVLMGLINLTGLMEMAMGWHRFALLNEVPSTFIFAEGNWPHIPYFWKLVQIALAVFVLVIVPFTAFVMFVKNMSFMADVDVFDLKYQLPQDFLSGLATVWLVLRLGLILPAAAVGVDMSIWRSIRLTYSVRHQVLIIAAMFSLYGMVGEGVGALLMIVVEPSSNLFFLLTWLINLPVGLVGFFLGVAVLNSLFVMLYEEEPRALI